MITIIAAVAVDGGIGRRGDLLWHLKEDLRHFKQITMGQPVVMGRMTWESLPKRPLPGRKNIVISRNKDYHPAGAELAASLREALEMAEDGLQGENREIFIIGGGRIYADAISIADALELTEIEDIANDADTFFPAIENADWKIISSRPGEENGKKYKFVRYERITRSDENSDN